MVNPNIFCNVPWTNMHVYWDGSFGMCCSESSKIYNDSEKEKHNLSKMTASKWFNSVPMQNIRQSMHGSQKISACSQCYQQENFGYESRRIKENFKSVIFTELGFEKSYQQSPWHTRFENSKENGLTDNIPIDWHIDLGSECNYACKMCSAEASSKIASLLKKHGKYNGKIVSNWTDDPVAYANFFQSIDETNIKRIHFMGGEPTVSKKFFEIIDRLLEKNRTEISLSFVTNGTNLNDELINKLKKFANIDIEISIESLYINNDYIRQGCNIEKLIKTLLHLKSQQDDKLQIVLRTVPQLLSIYTYPELIEWAYDNNFIIEGIPLSEPDYLQTQLLPEDIKQHIIKKFKLVKDKINNGKTFNKIQNGRSLGTLNEKLVRECDAMIKICSEPLPVNHEELNKKLIKNLLFWDKIYNLDALQIFPQYKEWLEKLNYARS